MERNNEKIIEVEVVGDRSFDPTAVVIVVEVGVSWQHSCSRSRGRVVAGAGGSYSWSAVSQQHIVSETDDF